MLWAAPALATGPWYVDSVTGSDSNAGTAWGAGNAFATLGKGITTAANNGDTIYVAQEHNETTSVSGVTYTLSNNAALPTKIFCANQAGTVPPVSADLCTSTFATTTDTNGNSSFTLTGHGYIYGVIFSSTGSGTSQPIIIGGTTNYDITCELCQFNTTSTSSSTAAQLGTSGSSSRAGRIFLINTKFTFGNAGQHIQLYNGYTTIVGNGASPPALLAGTIPTTLFTGDNYSGSNFINVIGEDLSALNSGHSLVSLAFGGTGWFRFIDDKLGASVTATTGTPADSGGPRVSIENSDSGTQNYRYEYYEYAGSFVTNTATVHTGGASDGTTPVSWQVTTSANATVFTPLRIGPIPIWVGTTGSHTPTIEIATNNLTLNNNDIWVEAQYLGSSATPIATRDLSNRIADFLPSTSAGAQPTSTATWTGVPGTPVKQKLAPSALTFNMKGYYEAYIYVAKPSIAGTLFIDPLITVN